MIPCNGRTDGEGWGGGAGVGYPQPEGHRMSGGEGVADSISKLYKNNRRGLGPEWSMSEVVKSPPNNSYKPHVLVASNTNRVQQ